MITKQQFEEIGLDVDMLTGNAAIEWIAANTTIETADITTLSASARLFIKKYCELDQKPIGVASESIEGLSQSFNQENGENAIWDLAEKYLSPHLKSRVRFVTAQRKWW